MKDHVHVFAHMQERTMRRSLVFIPTTGRPATDPKSYVLLG